MAALAALPATGQPLTEARQGAVPTQTHQRVQHAGHAAKRPGIALRQIPAQKAAETETEEELITAPQGTVHSNLVRSSLSFDVEFNQAYVDEVYSMVGEYVEGKDGYLYVKNPFAYNPTDTYMKLKIEGQTAVLEGPQLIYRDDVTGTGQLEDLYVMRVKYSTEEEWYLPDEGAIVFDYRDGVLSQRYEEDVMYGLTTSDGSWLGYGDWNLTLKPLENNVIEMPANAEETDYTFSYFMGAQLVKGAVADNYVFIKGINPDMPEACIRGSLQDGKVVFPARQYLGVYEQPLDAATVLYYHTFFMPAIIVQEWVEELGEYVDLYQVEDGDIVFDYDAATGAMQTDGICLLNASDTQAYYVSAYHQPKFKPYSGKKPAMPATPVVTEQIPIKDHFGDGDVYGGIAFICMPFDTEGNYLDLHDLYYNVVINDELFTFTPEEFVNLSEPMTDVPYFFTDEYDFQISDIYRVVYFTNPEYEKIGVQAKYTVDGVTNVTPVAYFGDPVDGVESVEDGVEKVTEVYTDLTGRRVSHPDKGIYIKTVTYTDGRVESSKVLK